MFKQALFAERYVSKVCAVFTSPDEAKNAMQQIRSSGILEPGQLNLSGPRCAQLEQALEPESRGVAKTLCRTHILFGALGLVLGVLAGLALVMSGVVAFSWNPLVSVTVTTAFGLVIGLMVGGFVGLRPDQDLMISKANQAIRSNRWVLIVHARSRHQAKRAQDILDRLGSTDTVATL